MYFVLSKSLGRVGLAAREPSMRTRVDPMGFLALPNMRGPGEISNSENPPQHPALQRKHLTLSTWYENCSFQLTLQF